MFVKSMKECEDGILNQEEFSSLAMSSQDKAVALFREQFIGDENMEKKAEAELRGRMDDIADQRRKDNTIKIQSREQAITSALDVGAFAVDDR